MTACQPQCARTRTNHVFLGAARAVLYAGRTMHHAKNSLAVLSFITLLSSVARADPPRAEPPPPPPPREMSRVEPPRSVFRIDVSVTGLDDARAATPATYTLMLQENTPGVISTGANVPLQVTAGGASGAAGTSVARQDVGLRLHFNYTMRAEVVVLSGDVEMSSAVPSATPGPVTLHRLRAESVVPITPGTPVLFSSVYDLTSHRRYEITVNARRML